LVVRGYPRTGCSIALAAHSGPEQFGSQLGARSADVLPACVQSAGLPAACRQRSVGMDTPTTSAASLTPAMGQTALVRDPQRLTGAKILT